MSDLVDQIRSCRLCAARFAVTETAHEPRPVVWLHPSARVLVAGQAPGLRVHASGRPFDDPSGRRLRAWMGLSDREFYDKSRVAIVPMAFCFPGYDTRGADLPPPRVCGETWHASVMDILENIELTLVVGAHAHRYHLGTRQSVTETARTWRAHAPKVFPLPHPSWRNTGWLKKNPWFERDLLPEMRDRVQEVMNG